MPTLDLSTDELVAVWRKIIVGDDKSWVLFRHGTCVVIIRPQADPRQQAKSILEDWGPVGTDNPVADYRAVKLTKDPGWVVACQHPDILTYLSPSQFDEETPSEDRVGLLGRGRRYTDAIELDVVHIEHRAA